MYKLLSMLLFLLSVFQEVLPMRSVAQRSLLRSAQSYKASVLNKPQQLYRTPQRNMGGAVLLGTTPVGIAAECCIAAGVGCKIAWEFYWYGTSATYNALFGPKKHLHKNIDDNYKVICDIYGQRVKQPWEEDSLDRFQLGGNYSEASNPDSKKLSNEDARKLAKELGYTETKDGNFDCHGQLKFKKGNSIITPDVDQHSGGTWKEFNRRDERKGTLDRNGKKIGN